MPGWGVARVGVGQVVRGHPNKSEETAGVELVCKGECLCLVWHRE